MNMREFWANEAAMMRDKSGVLGNNASSAVSEPDPDLRLNVPIRYYYNEQGLPLPIIEVRHAKKGYINIVTGTDNQGRLTILNGLRLANRPNQTDIAIIRTPNNGDFELPPWMHRHEIEGIIKDAQRRSLINGLLDYEMGGAGFIHPDGSKIHIRGEDGRGKSQLGNESRGDYLAKPTEPFKGRKFPPNAPRITAYVDKVYQFPLSYHYIRQGLRNNRIKEQHIFYLWHSHPDADETNLPWIQLPSPQDWTIIVDVDASQRGLTHYVISTKNSIVYFLNFKTLTTTNSVENDNYYGYSGSLPLKYFYNLPLVTR